MPFIALALLGGHIADARDRRRISLAVLVVMMAMSLCLYGFTLERGTPGVVRHKLAILPVIVVLGMCRSFSQPARAALNSEILPQSLFAKAIAIRTSLFQLAMVSGPAGGGLLYAAFGPGGAYLFSAALLVVSWSAMYRVPRVRHKPMTASSGLSVARSISQGFGYLASDRLLLAALLLDLFGVLFGGATALLPVYANEILAVGSRGFGILRAAPAVGALAASVMLASRQSLRRAGPTVLISTTVFCLAMFAFGVSKSFWLSIALLALSGVADMVSIVVQHPPVTARKVSICSGAWPSINQIFIGSSNEIGAFESGYAARLPGVVPSVVFGGHDFVGDRSNRLALARAAEARAARPSRK